MIRMLAFLVVACLVTTAATADPVLRWTPADTTITPGDASTLSVMLDDTLTVRTIELYVSYDPDVVSTISGGPGALFDGFNNLFQGFGETHPAQPGQWHGYCVILGAGDWTVGPGELYRWTVQGDAVGISTVVADSLILLPPGGGDYTEVTLPSTTLRVFDVLLDVPAADSAISLAVAPNPFNPRTRIVVDGAAGLAGYLDVLDARGYRVARLWRGLGVSNLDWDGRDDGGRALPSGVYTFVLTGNGGTRAQTRGTLLR